MLRDVKNSCKDPPKRLLYFSFKKISIHKLSTINKWKNRNFFPSQRIIKGVYVYLEVKGGGIHKSFRVSLRNWTWRDGVDEKENVRTSYSSHFSFESSIIKDTSFSWPIIYPLNVPLGLNFWTFQFISNPTTPFWRDSFTVNLTLLTLDKSLLVLPLYPLL